MDGLGRAYIFHLYRRGGKALILHPFETPERLIALAETVQVLGRYGQEPEIQALTSLRADLHQKIERGVERWLAELRFVPKFLAAAAAFLVVYFFFSFAVRDPLPVLDEVVLGAGAAVLTFVLMGRADQRSSRAATKRANLRAIVDRVRFVESPFVRSVERALAEGESGTLQEWLARISDGADWAGLSPEAAEEARCFVDAVESRYQLRGGHREERALKRLIESRDASRLEQWRRAVRIDVPLYAVYRRIKRSVAAGSSL